MRKLNWGWVGVLLMLAGACLYLTSRDAEGAGPQPPPACTYGEAAAAAPAESVFGYDEMEGRLRFPHRWGVALASAGGVELHYVGSIIPTGPDRCPVVALLAKRPYGAETGIVWRWVEFDALSPVDVVIGNLWRLFIYAPDGVIELTR